MVRYSVSSDGLRSFQRGLAGVNTLAVAVCVIAVGYTNGGQASAGPSMVPEAAATAMATASSTPPAVRFTDVTRQAGIEFRHVSGAYGEKFLPETMGGGVAFFDYDNDGDQDLLFVNSSYWPDHASKEGPGPTQALYRNDGRGMFKDVTRASGLDVDVYGMGVAVGDYDGDGWRDVFITAVGGNHLYRNENGIFRDVANRAGVSGDPEIWGTSAAFIDYDRDGDLDLFVVNYMRWTMAIDQQVGRRFAYIQMGGKRAFITPEAYEGAHATLYRNDGGVFRDVSAQTGMQVANEYTGLPQARGLGVVPVDINRDGWIDLVVANDKTPNFCFVNQRDGTFGEDGFALGLALDAFSNATSGMGIDAAHYHPDGALGIAVGNYSGEMDSLFVSQADPLQFADVALGEGIGAPTRLSLTFGLFFFDYDLDGRLDLFQANGHLEPEIRTNYPNESYAQPAQLFWNCGKGCDTTFAEVVDGAGDLSRPIVGRGASYADFDGDGDLDVVVTQIDGAPLLLRNDQHFGHHWLRVKLVGKAGNRDAIGARLALTAGGSTQHRHVMPTRSYLSQVELPVTFGLGAATSIESLRIWWPDGTGQVLEQVPVDAVVTVEQEAARPDRD